MASNLFGRYVWLIDLLRQYKHLSYKEINAKWKISGLSYGESDELALRTFHNHRNAIRDIFDVNIEIDKSVSGYKYHIENVDKLQKDLLRSWLIDSYATINQLQIDVKLENRIQFEHIPSGSKWLTLFIQAMRDNNVVEISYKGFDKRELNTFIIEPYILKLVRRRWYIIANNPYYENLDFDNGKELKGIRVYSLDRIIHSTVTNQKFKMKSDFDFQNLYDGCVGIMYSSEPLERVVLRAYYNAPNYLRTLPLHKSQREIAQDENSTTFAYDVKITYDFLQLIMQQGDQVEVLEPISLRAKMRDLAKTLMSYYK